MKVMWLAIFVVSLLTGGFRTISSINHYASEAAQAYHNKDYTEAIAAYTYLLTELEVQDDQLQLNLAHAYYRMGKYTEALQAYQLLADNPANRLRSIAHLQLGNIATKHKKYKEAISLFKQALLTDPGNEEARFNYELLKKYLDMHPELEDKPEDELPSPEHKQADTDSTQLPPPLEEELQPKKKPDLRGDREEEIDHNQQDQSGEQKEGGVSEKKNDQKPQQKEKEQASGSDKGDAEGINKDNQFDPTQQDRTSSYDNVSETDEWAQTKRIRLQKADLSPEKAKLLLDAMRNAELQYIQQLPRKSGKKPDRSKPDW
jgi:tetratricopeptide (TPR) repeat protein